MLQVTKVLELQHQSRLVSFRIDWFDLLAVQGTLKSSLGPQFEGINSLMLRLLYGPTLTSIHDYEKYKAIRKTIALARWTFVGKVMSLLSNILSRLVITFHPRSKRLLFSWLQSPLQ